jgi:hypothetical protein
MRLSLLGIYIRMVIAIIKYSYYSLYAYKVINECFGLLSKSIKILYSSFNKLRFYLLHNSR